MKKRHHISKIWMVPIILIILIAVILLAGQFMTKNNRTADNTSSDSQPTASDWYIDTIAYSYSDYGIFYQSDNYVHFCDPTSGINTIICDQADCQHQKETCSAYIDGTAYIVMDGKKLIYLSNENATIFGQQGLYEADVNGSNRRQLASFEEIQTITGVVFTDEWLFIAYYNQYDENMESLDADTAAVYAYNRTTGKGSILWSDTQINARLMNVGVYDNQLYVTYIYYDLTADELLEHADDSDYMTEHFHSNLCMLSLDGEMTCIAEDVDTACVSDAGVFYSLIASDASVNDSADDNSAGGNSVDNNLSDSAESSRNLYCYLSQSEDIRIVGDYLFAIPSFTGTLSFLRSYGTEQSLYFYDAESEELTLLNSSLTDTIPIVIFDQYAYVRDYSEDDGNGQIKYITRSDLEAGEYTLSGFSGE